MRVVNGRLVVCLSKLSIYMSKSKKVKMIYSRCHAY